MPRLEAAHAAERASTILRESGVVRLDHLLPAAVASRLRAYCDAELDRSLDALARGQLGQPPDAIFAPHLLRGNQYGHRHDLMLPLAPLVIEALRLALPPLAPSLARLLGDDAELFELSAVTSGDGTPAQTMHADFPNDDPHAPFGVVIFVALHDLQPTHGPTHFAVGTHSAEFASAIDKAWHPVHGSASMRSNLMRQQTLLAPPLRAGDAVLMDSALYHAGGANSAGERRTLFHFTFARRGARPGKRKASLLTQLAHQHTLAERRTWLGPWLCPK